MSPRPRRALPELPELTAVVVPIGGGGMISGIATAIREQRPEIRVYGVEASAAASALASRKAGEVVTIEPSETSRCHANIRSVGNRNRSDMIIGDPARFSYRRDLLAEASQSFEDVRRIALFRR